MGPRRNPAQRFRWGEDERRSERALPRAAERGIRSPRGRRASIASDYTPATVPGGSPGPLLRPEGQRAERRNARLLHAGITMPLTKRTAVSQKGVENPPVWPCEPLCGANGAGAASICPPEQVFSSWRHRVTEGSDDCWNTLPPESRVNLPVKNIAGERTGAFAAPVLSQLPAVRAVAGF